MKNKPKILFLDLETAPNVLLNWGLWADHGIPHGNIIQERYIICASWKWQGDKTIYAVSVSPDDPANDLDVVRVLHDIWSQADAIVAHNGDMFDVKWLKTRVIAHGLPPLPPIIQIDTKKLAKSNFYFNSNRLDYLAQFFGIGQKIKTEYDLWKSCMDGDYTALAKMVEYNKHDVELLEQVYNILAPYVPAKVNQQLFGNGRDSCSLCGSHKIQYRGYTYTKARKYRRYQCTSCHAWGRSHKAEKDEN